MKERTEMKAFVQTRYCGPEELRLEEIPKPEVGEDDVLVRVKATSVNPADWHIMRARPHLVRLMMGLTRPKVPIRGLDVAGVVEAVGPAVTEFQPGDEVFGHKSRAFAEYVVGTEEHFVPKPEPLSFDEAAGIGVAGLTALQGLRDHGKLRAGQKILVTGASGGVGSFAVQIAKAMGAEVTGVCSTEKVELVRSLGADHVIDYTREDFTKRGERYDVIFYAAGTHSLRACLGVLTPEGTYVGVGSSKHGNWIGPVLGIVKPLVVSKFSKHGIATFIAKHSKEDLLYLARLVNEGKLTPVVDRTYPFEEIRDAIAYQEKGHARGKVIVAIGGRT